MKSKNIIIGIVVVLLVGAGIFAFIKWRGAGRGPGGDDDENTPNTTPPLVTVQTGEIKVATLRRYVQGYGLIEPAPAMSNQPSAGAIVSAPVAGVAAKVDIVDGQRVKKGEMLAVLNSGTITFENATQQVERQKKLYAQQNTSLKNLQDAEAQLALLQITSPLSGTVTQVNVRPGQAVDLSTVVAEITDLDRLAVRTEIPIAEMTGLKTGDALEILTEPPLASKVSYISPDVGASNGTVRVLALLPAKSSLRPGQFLPLRIVTAVHENCLAVPVESVVTDEAGKSVIALVKGDEAVRTPVQTGFREMDLVEVSAPGLKAGETVVTVGAYGLPEKTKIRVENSLTAK